MPKVKKKLFFLFAVSFFILFSWSFAKADNLVSLNFNVDKNFDAVARSQVTAVLVKTSPNLYFYVDKSWWEMQTPARQSEILNNLDVLSSEFDGRIYPILTSVFGSEWKPGVDGDNRITILFHSMKEGVSGYFRSADEYLKLQIPDSNEKEMLYLSLANIDDQRLKIFLSHEFTHLITFNQKNRLQGVQEEVWLNEARADYSSTMLGYDDLYDGSNLQRRVRDFLQNPQDPLTEWQETKYDYAVASVFTHYLADHYSIKVLADSLKSKLVGIPSINEALFKDGAKEDFSQAFTNWTITAVINDCSQNQKYCYLDKNLKNLRIIPTLNFLPLSGNSSLSVTNITKNWSGNWQKIIGGDGDLKLEFESLQGLNFQVPYLIFDKDNNYSLNFLPLDKNQKGEIDIKDFGSKYNSLIIIPSLQSKFSGFDGLELTYPYTFTASIGNFIPKPNNNLCQQITSNLYFGIFNNDQVRCLQQFLKGQGADIYPEGLVTGYFGRLTKLAVMRFQKKYGIIQTGFVGPLTRSKINQFLNAI